MTKFFCSIYLFEQKCKINPENHFILIICSLNLNHYFKQKFI